jgi:pectinesterase
MSVDNPSERIVQAVTAAVEWLQAHAIKDMVQVPYVNTDGKPDRRLVHQFGAPLIWARYYDLDTEEPFVCDRDGVKQPAMEYIGYERRTGYGWYSNSPQNVIDKYPKWLKKVQKKKAAEPQPAK